MTYKVIEHNNSKALRQEPEMIKPSFRGDYWNIDTENEHKAIEDAAIEYQEHLADCAKNIIDIAPEYQDKWEVEDLVKDSEFECRINGINEKDNTLNDFVAIPLLEQEKEEGLDWQEQARLFAESKMPENWNGKDFIEVGTFYHHYIRFIVANYHITKKSKQ